MLVFINIERLEVEKSVLEGLQRIANESQEFYFRTGGPSIWSQLERNKQCPNGQRINGGNRVCLGALLQTFRHGVGPVSQDQTTTILIFRHCCMVLKFQDHTTTGCCPGGCFSIVLISLCQWCYFSLTTFISTDKFW